MTIDTSKIKGREIPTERTPLVDVIRFNNDDSTWKLEYSWLGRNSLPIIGTYLLQNSLQLTSVITLGHLGATELGAAALGSMFASVTAWSTSFGMASALDTLCSQAFTGAKDKTLVGLHLQRALVIISIMFVPIALIWLNATRIFLALNQEPDLALHAGIFLRYLLIGAPFFIAFECVKKYLQAQGIMKASSYVLLITAPINVVMNYSFVYIFKMGFFGAPLATSFSYMIMFSLLLLYIIFIDGKKAWGGWSRDCLSDWGPFLKLAYPGVISISAEWWAFELSALCASYLSTTDLAAQSILLTAGSNTYTFPFSVSVAASNRVGNCLGGMAPLKAKRAAATALVFAIIFGILNSTFFITTRSWFGYMFTSDEDVVERVAAILPICALFQVTDGLAGVSGGVIRGIGKQKISAFLNLFAYYGIAAPLGYLLTFKANLGLTGIWLGLTVALFLSSSTQMIYLWTVNWDKESKDIHDRIKQAEDKVHDEHQDPIDPRTPLIETA